jgi:hypothetical protein
MKYRFKFAKIACRLTGETTTVEVEAKTYSTAEKKARLTAAAMDQDDWQHNDEDQCDLEEEDIVILEHEHDEDV